VFRGIDIDFNHLVETNKGPFNFYINIKGNYSVAQKDVSYDYTISTGPNKEDISHLIETFSNETFTEIETLIEKKVNEYIIECSNEKLEENYE